MALGTAAVGVAAGTAKSVTVARNGEFGASNSVVAALHRGLHGVGGCYARHVGG